MSLLFIVLLILILLLININKYNLNIKLFSTLTYVIIWFGLWNLLDNIMIYYFNQSINNKIIYSTSLILFGFMLLYIYPKLV